MSPSLRCMVRTVKARIREDSVPFHEVILFMRNGLYSLPCCLVIMVGGVKVLPMNIMVHKCLPLLSRVISELCITDITIYRLLFLLRNLPHIGVLKCHQFYRDNSSESGVRENLAYPRHLNLSTFHVCNQSSLPLLPMLMIGYIRKFLRPPLGTQTLLSSLPFSSCVTRL